MNSVPRSRGDLGRTRWDRRVANAGGLQPRQVGTDRRAVRAVRTQGSHATTSGGLAAKSLKRARNLWRAFATSGGNENPRSICAPSGRCRACLAASFGLRIERPCGVGAIALTTRAAARFWTAPVLWRFGTGQRQSKAAEDGRTPRRCRAPSSVGPWLPSRVPPEEKAAEGCRSPRRKRWPEDRQVLDCASPLALFKGARRPTAAEDGRSPRRCRAQASACWVQGPSAGPKGTRSSP